jgi:intracellular septation protein A
VNLRIVTSIAPVAVFYLLTRVADPWVAVLGGFIASTVVFAYNRRDRLIGVLTAFSFGIVTISAVVGIFANSEKAYLAAGPIGDFAFVLLYLGSVAVRKPLIGGIARELLPRYAGHVPVSAGVFVWLTLAWAGYDLVHGLARIWMLQEMSVGEYIIWSRLAFWPFSSAMVGITAMLAIREGKRRPRPSEYAQPAMGAEPRPALSGID